jgi:hypothetical protein
MRKAMTLATIAVLTGLAGTATAKAVPQVGKAKQVFAALFEKLPTQAAAVK